MDVLLDSRKSAFSHYQYNSSWTMTVAELISIKWLRSLHSNTIKNSPKYTDALNTYTSLLCFMFERAKAPRHFSLVQDTHKQIVNFFWGISRAPRQWSRGMEAIAFVASMKYQTCLHKTLSKDQIHLTEPRPTVYLMPIFCTVRI